MRKLIVSAISILVMTFASASTQDVVKDPAATTTTTSAPVKSEIKSSDLPVAVKSSLAAPEFKGWDIAETALEVKDADGQITSYTVALKNTATAANKIVHITSDGKIVKE